MAIFAHTNPGSQAFGIWPNPASTFLTSTILAVLNGQALSSIVGTASGCHISLLNLTLACRLRSWLGPTVPFSAQLHVPSVTWSKNQALTPPGLPSLRCNNTTALLGNGPNFILNKINVYQNKETWCIGMAASSSNVLKR